MPVPPVPADAEDDEADREAQREEDEDPLGLAPQLREEHVRFDVPVLRARRSGRERSRGRGAFRTGVWLLRRAPDRAMLLD